MIEGHWSGDGRKFVAPLPIFVLIFQAIQDGFVYNDKFTTNKYRALA